MRIIPVTYKQACEFISLHHRHHKPPQGWKFGIACEVNNKIVGVACVGRPVARMADDGKTCEVTRLCSDGTKNVCSKLYSAAARAAREMGYQKIITYILESESGHSLRATGWTMKQTSNGGSWSRPSRPRADKAPLVKKVRWEKQLSPTPREKESEK